MDRFNHQGIVNIVNFIRGIEPRPGRNIDLIEPVVRQIELAKKHRLPVTWLIQYDALIDERFLAVLKEIQPEDEIGVWFEFVQPLVEKAGLKWRGRYPWDWHVNVGFSVGYSVEERLRMIDIFLEDFQATFGYAPKAAGSWLIDAASLVHLDERHGITAFCNCKDQWGTDGYTLWGGYFNQAYYPSRLNSYIPAQTRERQIGIPTFRMLGSDPIHQYETSTRNNGQSVITLEPISLNAGDNPAWIDRFFQNMFETPCLSFGYTQAGQENSFGWPRMEKGLVYQHRRLEEMRDRGLVRVETLSTSGAWFKARYETTPPSAVVAERDLDSPERGALWYCSKNYRASLVWDGPDLRLRDIQLFDENREEPFLHRACETSDCKYDALPVLDGFLWSSDSCRAGLRIVELHDGTPYELKRPVTVVEDNADTLLADVDGRFVFRFQEASFELRGDASGSWGFAASWAPGIRGAFLGIEGDRLLFSHEGVDYVVRVLHGTARNGGNGFLLIPDENGLVKLGLRAPY